jgi:hypothetical protein
MTDNSFTELLIQLSKISKNDANTFIEIWKTLTPQKEKQSILQDMKEKSYLWFFPREDGTIQIADVNDMIGALLISVLLKSIDYSNYYAFFKLLVYINEKDFLRFLEVPPDVHICDDDSLLLENLNDLFGQCSTKFIHFINSILPSYILDTLLRTEKEKNAINMYKVKAVLIYAEHRWQMYNYTIRKVGDFHKYIERYRKNKQKGEESYYLITINPDELPSTISPLLRTPDTIREETHLIQNDVFMKVVKQYEREGRVFGYPCIAMVVSGGVGPRGKGFAYLTPKNEVIEICLDLRLNMAYIIEYKKMLKSKFIADLEERMTKEKISEEIIIKILGLIDRHLNLDVVNFSDMNEIWHHIYSEVGSYLNMTLLLFLKQSIQNILLPIKMEDQFKLRMDLIKKGQLDPKDVSKMVSLENVSHFDVLCQRRFFLILFENMLRMLDENPKTSLS